MVAIVLSHATVGRPAGGAQPRRVHQRRDGAADLKKGPVKPWQRKEWCIASVGAGFVCAMEDVLDLYAEPYDPKHPVVCFDEKPLQLLEETRLPRPVAPGQPALVDYDTGARARPTSSWPSNRWPAGAR